MARVRRDYPLSETQAEQIAQRVRRVFWVALCVSVVMVLVIVVLAPTWATLPAAFRYGFPALLLWLLLVAGYGFYSETRVSSEMRETLRQKSFIDEVTQVFNYRYLDLRLAEEAERTRRHGGLTAVLYLDLDGFKKVNDDFGHPVGNIVLQQVAGTMAQRVRSCDVLGRVGGDEFLAVLPQTDRREAYVLAERLREAVEGYVLEIEDGHVIDFIRVSIGVAAYPVNGETMENVVTAADNAVYQSKDEGGNRVCLADEFITSDLVGRRIVNTIRGEETAG